jgi:Mg2+-importing ATPase
VSDTAERSDTSNPRMTQAVGLTSNEARSRLEANGPNEVASAKRFSAARLLLSTVLNPLALILLVAGCVAAAVGDLTTTTVIVVVVAVSSTIQVFQTIRSDQAVRALQDRVAVTATVNRDGSWIEVPRREIVVGDLIRLGAGDLVPADAQLVAARDLHVQQAALTGESLPAEKEIPLTPLPSPAGGEGDKTQPSVPPQSLRIFRKASTA